MDEESKNKLMENSLTLYLENEEKLTRAEDMILEDEDLLRQIDELWRTNEPTLRTLIRVINTDLIKYMVEQATPIETVPLRHELQGAEKILRRLQKYSEEYQRLIEKKKQDEEAEEEDPDTVEEGEEETL